MNTKKTFKLFTFILLSNIFICVDAVKAQLSKNPVQNNALAFESVETYEKLLASDDKEKENFYSSLNELNGFFSLKKAMLAGSNNSSIPDSMLEDIDFIQNVVNSSGVIKIGRFYYKIDYTNEKIYAVGEEKASNHFEEFMQGKANEENGIGVYDINDNAVDQAESGFKKSFSEDEIASEADSEAERFRLFCWRGTRAYHDPNNKIGMYFKDETDPKFSSYTRCVNSSAAGQASTNTRLKLRPNYIALGIYHTLYMKAKMQRQSYADCPVIDRVTTWCTVNADVAESRWSVDYSVRYKGRCRRDNEVNESNTLRPPLNAENKTRKVFWESIRGLAYYCLTYEANLFTAKAFILPATDQEMCVGPDQPVIEEGSPRVVNSKELTGGQRLIYNSRTQCR